MSMEFEVLSYNLNDATIIRIDAPGYALPGSSPIINVTVQILYDHANDVYCVIRDPAISGSKPYGPVMKRPSGGVGSYLEFPMKLNNAFWMPDAAWTLEVEIGFVDWLGKWWETDSQYITIEVENPFPQCPEGYHLDPETGECVQNEPAGIEDNTLVVYAVGGLFLAGLAYLFVSKSKKS